MRILVTGGAGFIGSHLVDALLARGNDVTVVDDLSLGRQENIAHLSDKASFSFVKLDILQRDEFHKIFASGNFDAVFHLAANSDIKAGSEDRELDMRKNFLTTLSVLECMKQYNVKNIVFSSTSAIYGEMLMGQKIQEQSGPLFPVSFYGASKLAAEGYISTYSRLFDIKALIVRFPNVVGPRATHGILFDFLNKLRANPSQLTVLGDGKQHKPYIYVAELVEAILFCWKNANEKLNFFNIGPTDTASVSTIAAIVLDELGMKDTLIHYTGGTRGWPGDVPFYEYDTSKIATLGWAQKNSSEQAIRKAFRAMISKVD